MDEMNNDFPKTEGEGWGEPPVTGQAEPSNNTDYINGFGTSNEPPQNPVYQPDNTYQPPEQPSSGYVYFPQGYTSPQSQWQSSLDPRQVYPPVNPIQPDDRNIGNMRDTNRKGRRIFLIVLAIVVAISAIAIPISFLNKSGSFDNGETTSKLTNSNEKVPSLDINDTPVTESTPPAGEKLTAEQVYAKVAASNVAVIVYKNNQIYTEGTGIIMKEDDAGEYTYILTCAHVISDSGVELAVQMEDGTRYDAEMVGYDLRTDIGIIRIEASGLSVAEFGNSDSLKVGNKVYAIGNPGGAALFGTFTDGMVSAIGRNITSSIGYDMVCIQHNAAISPGNSGGALVNEYGQVIGINSSKIAATEFEGISFSIPITQAKDIIDSLMTWGYVPGRPKLGISYVANDSSEISSIYGMAVQMKGLPSGSLVIYSITEDSDLNNTNVKPGDMITAVNGRNLDTPDVLLELIEQSAVGDELELSIFRIESVGGRYTTEEFTVKVKLIEER